MKFLKNQTQTYCVIAGVTFLILLFISLRTGYVALELLVDGAQTNASILDAGSRVDRNAHGSSVRTYFVDYSYFANGQEYEGHAGVGTTDQGYGDGGTITITYLRSDPSISSYSPTGMFFEGACGIFFSIIVLVISVWQFFKAGKAGNAAPAAPQIEDDESSFLRD